jgi:Uma2 family endonuclease
MERMLGQREKILMVAAPLEHDRPLTHEDLEKFPDDGNRYELLQGELIVSPSPAGIHQVVLGRLYADLKVAARTARFGTVIIAPFDVRFSRSNVVEPDLIAFSQDQYPQYKGTYFEGAPAFVVEVLSPGSVKYDRVRKANLYMEHGVQEYWVVEPQSNRVLIHVAGIDEPMPRIVTAGIIASAVIPEFQVDLEALFAPELETFD